MDFRASPPRCALCRRRGAAVAAVAAAASTSTKTGATFKEGAESPWSPAACCWRTPTLLRGPTTSGGGTGKQVRSRVGAGRGRGSAPPSSVPGPRLRLHSPHLNQEAAESAAPLLRPFLCVGPGAKEGTDREGRGAVPFAVRGRGAAAALGRPGAWGAHHRDPLGFSLVPPPLFLRLFFF